MKTLGSICQIIALALLLPATAANAGGLECAIQTALEGPQNAKVYLFDHSFAVHPPVITDQQKRKHTLVGKLIHLNSTGKGEEIAYRILKENGAIKEIGLQIGGGKWQPISKPVLSALGDYLTGAPMPEEKQRAVALALEKAVDKTWLRAAEFLIAHVAVRHC
jgi:hypothetical protein